MTARAAGTPTRLVRSNPLFCAAVILGPFIVERNLLLPLPFAEPDSLVDDRRGGWGDAPEPRQGALAEADGRTIVKQRR